MEKGMQLRPSTIISRLEQLADAHEREGDYVVSLVLREAAGMVARSVPHTLEKLEDTRAELRRVEAELARGQE